MAKDISKLPVWAQRRIKILEADLVYAKNQNALVSAGDTSITVGRYLDGFVNIPDNTQVRFHNSDDPRSYIEVAWRYTGRDDNRRLEARASSHAMIHLVVMPEASNIVVLDQIDL